LGGGPQFDESFTFGMDVIHGVLELTASRSGYFGER
jgi:hypothetical protein